MHAAPGGQTGDNIDDSWGYPFLFESAESQDLTVNIWRKACRRAIEMSQRLSGLICSTSRLHLYFDVAKPEPKAGTALPPRRGRHQRGRPGTTSSFLAAHDGTPTSKSLDHLSIAKLVYTFHKYLDGR